MTSDLARPLSAIRRRKSQQQLRLPQLWRGGFCLRRPQMIDQRLTELIWNFESGWIRSIKVFCPTPVYTEVMMRRQQTGNAYSSCLTLTVCEPALASCCAGFLTSVACRDLTSIFIKPHRQTQDTGTNMCAGLFCVSNIYRTLACPPVLLCL